MTNVKQAFWPAFWIVTDNLVVAQDFAEKQTSQGYKIKGVISTLSKLLDRVDDGETVLVIECGNAPPVHMLCSVVRGMILRGTFKQMIFDDNLVAGDA